MQWILAGLTWLATVAVAPQDDTPTWVVDWEALEALAPDAKAALRENIQRRLDESEDPGLQEWRRLAARARRELKVIQDPGFEWYDPKVYAPGQKVVRKPVARDSNAWEDRYQRYRPWENHAQFLVALRYDFGRNRALRLMEELDLSAWTWNLLNGYPPDADLLLAWLESRFDHADQYDDLARHFDHMYCDLEGNAYPDITLYDAMSSQNGLDMPDVDTIPFAWNFLKDRSYRSPIPAARQQTLYQPIQRAFLPYFQHRTMVEALAHVYLDPDAWLREDHEGMRENLQLLIADHDGDVDRIRRFLVQAEDRGGLMMETLEIARQEKGWRRTLARRQEWVAASQWAVAEAAAAVLEEFGLLHRGG